MVNKNQTHIKWACFLFPSTFVLKHSPRFFHGCQRFHGHQGLDEIDLPTARLFAGSAGFRGQYLSKYPLELRRPLKRIGFSPKTIVLVGNLNHPKLGTIILIVLDFQGILPVDRLLYIPMWLSRSRSS